MDTNRERVLQCIVDLHNDRRSAARRLIADLLDMKLTVVDEAVKRLREDGLVRMIIPGVFEPIEQHPPSRPLCFTSLPDGRVRLEVDDILIEFTPHEAQQVGRFLHGHAVVNLYRDEERLRGEEIARLATQVRSLQRQLQLTQRRMAHAPQGTRGQGDLFHLDEPPARPAVRRGPHLVA